jgi:hypothetical protein
MTMKLKDYKPNKGMQIADIRSRVTGRTIKFSYHNINVKRYNTKILGKISIKMSQRDVRTVRKYDSFEQFLLSRKKAHISKDVWSLRDRMLKNVSKNLGIVNMESALSHANAQITKSRINNYIRSLYIPFLTNVVNK